MSSVGGRNSIGDYIREQRKQAQISIRQLSRAAGVSNPYLSQVERGLRKPSADILQQIAKGLRISAEALYVQAGMLDPRLAQATVADAVRTDPELTERQKQMLIEIYESFRKEVRAAADARAAAETWVVADDVAGGLDNDVIVASRSAAIAAGGPQDAAGVGAAWQVSAGGEIGTPADPADSEDEPV